MSSSIFAASLSWSLSKFAPEMVFLTHCLCILRDASFCSDSRLIFDVQILCSKNNYVNQEIKPNGNVGIKKNNRSAPEQKRNLPKMHLSSKSGLAAKFS